jgi:hypothetical protein
MGEQITTVFSRSTYQRIQTTTINKNFQGNSMRFFFFNIVLYPHKRNPRKKKKIKMAGEVFYRPALK